MLAHIDILKMTVTVSISNESTYLLQHMVWVIYKRVYRRIEKHLLCDLSYTSGPLRDQKWSKMKTFTRGPMRDQTWSQRNSFTSGPMREQNS